MRKSDFPMCFVKKGKTRGRPSNWELFMSKKLSDKYKENIKAIDNVIFNQIVYGRSAYYINEDANIVVV